MALSARHRRLALQQLGRDRLAELTAQHDLDVADRRAADSHVEALIAARKVDFGAVLATLKREELQAICDALGLDRGGREKDLLVSRILAMNGNGNGNGQTDADSPAGSGPAFLLTPASPKESKKPSQPRRSSSSGDSGVADYRHDETRKNNPPAGLIEFDRPPPEPTKTYAYDPHQDPTLQWAGKAERTSFEIDTVSLHIHESVSTQAILRAVKREDVQGDLFARFELPDSKEIQFYQHDVGWRNRLVLGDSLLVMNSLIEREHMAGKVQCIYVDPPYGVKFNSNFQPAISRRDVKDGDDASLTREPEQIQAYRDTWTLGIHSYLTYMRDRLLLARELLTESGSIFVQISDENVHHVRELLGEIFGEENFVSLISFAKTSGATSEFLATVCDYVLWYSKEKSQLKYRPLYVEKTLEEYTEGSYDCVEPPEGSWRRMTRVEKQDPRRIPPGWRPFMAGAITSSKPPGSFPVKFRGETYLPSSGYWKTGEDGFKRLIAADRIVDVNGKLRYKRYFADFPFVPMTNVWSDTTTGTYTDVKLYVVQTAVRAITRCVLMTTDPGDLVLDPTCGSGSTAYVAEVWGRRWITADTSRVALALARQRLLTARYPYYRLRSDRVRDGFQYRVVPHITLKSIAQNAKLIGREQGLELERAIRESADQEVLYDQPEVDTNRVRVSGPFTVEAIPTATLEQATESAEPGQPAPAASPTANAAGDYLGMMIDLVKKTGIQFPNGRNLPLPNLRLVRGPYEYLHAEADSGTNGGTKRVAVSFGPQHAPVTPGQVLGGINEARGYEIVIFVGFACDPEARRIIDAGVHGREIQFANAAPDILVKDLLKTTKTTKLFTVFGSPDVTVHPEKDDLVSVELTGIDLYDPNTGETRHSNGEDVAAWFVDHDYDSRTFCVCQALFPGGGSKNPWEKLQKALKGTIDEEKFEALRSTRSLPFKAGKKIAVKVIDDRGNEVIKLVEPKARGRGKGGS